MGMITTITVVGTGLLGGVYSAFTVMVIPALRQLNNTDATTTMNHINRAAKRGPFIVLFGGTAITATTLGIAALQHGNTTDLIVAGASLLSTAITIAANVPLNRALNAKGAHYWLHYAQHWTRWNTLRALAAAASVGVAAVGLGSR